MTNFLRSVSFKLVLVSVLCVIPSLMIAAVYLIERQHNQLMAEINRSLDNHVQFAKMILTADITNIAKTANIIAIEPTIERALIDCSSSDVSLLLGRVLSTFSTINYVMLVDEDMRSFVIEYSNAIDSQQDKSQHIGKSLADQPMWPKRIGKEVQITPPGQDLFLTSPNGDESMSQWVVSKVSVSGNAIGYLVISYQFGEAIRQLENAIVSDLEQQGYEVSGIAVSDGNGKVLIGKLQNRQQVLSRSLQLGMGNTRLLFELQFEKETTLRPVQQLTEVVIWVFISLLVLLVFGIYYTSKILILSRISEVASAANRFAKGEKQVQLPQTGQDELADLAKCFNEMAKKINQSTELLNQKVRKSSNEASENTAKLRATLDAAADAVITIDSIGIITSFNPAAERTFGYRSDEVIGKNVSILIPDAEQSAHQRYTKHSRLNSPKIINKGRELEGKRKDGSLFPLELNVAPLKTAEKGFVGILRDITERRRMEQLKNEFISTVSHELRTPLTSIRGSLGLLCGGVVGEIPAQAKEMLNIASNNTTRLLLLINDLLDLQKLSSGNMRFNLAELAIMPFIHQAVKENESYAREFGVQFSVTKAVDGTYVFADKDRLMQVMSNLLSNAAKFSKSGDVVEVKVAVTPNYYLRISVVDHGSGIPKEFQHQVFERFSQSDASDSRSKGGSGLGLSISKEIVEKHGGSMGFVSQAGVGTTMYFDLPQDMVKYFNRENQSKPIQHQLTSEQKIFVFEEDESIATATVQMLVSHGFECMLAMTSEQVEVLLFEQTERFGLLIVDLMAAKGYGLNLLKRIGQSEHYNQTPILVIAAQLDKETKRLYGKTLQISDWLELPIDEKRLLSTVLRSAKVSELPKVLHLEDDIDVFKVVSKVLQSVCEVVWVRSLTEAKEVLKQQSFDLIILDIGLPDGSGLELLEEIEQGVQAPKIVIFSAYDVAQEYAEKVNEVLLKSTTSNLQLIEVVKSLMPGAEGQMSED